MKQLLIYIAAIVLLSVSSFSFAMSDYSKAMTFTMVCYGAYDNSGQTSKARAEWRRIAEYSVFMSEKEIEDAKLDALRLVYTSQAKGITTKELANMCDKSTGESK
jgi:hypothetical protein